MATKISSEESAVYHRTNFISTYNIADDPYGPYVDYFGSSYVQLFQSIVKNFRSYTIKQRDTLDMISFRFYGTTSLWWAIALASTNIIHPLVLTAGQTLKIPNKADIDSFVLRYKNTTNKTSSSSAATKI